jgi:hypothetical protein
MLKPNSKVIAIIGVTLIIAIGIPCLVNYGIANYSLKSVSNDNEWLGFWGSFAGTIPTFLFSLVILNHTYEKDNKDTAKAKEAEDLKTIKDGLLITENALNKFNHYELIGVAIIEFYNSENGISNLNKNFLGSIAKTYLSGMTIILSNIDIANESTIKTLYAYKRLYFKMAFEDLLFVEDEEEKRGTIKLPSVVCQKELNDYKEIIGKIPNTCKEYILASEQL